MLDQMARAMASSGWIDSEDDLDAKWASDAAFRQSWIDFARLGLEGLRVPTDALIADACPSHQPRQPMSRRTDEECPAFESARQRWSQRIDAILGGQV